MNFQLQPIDGAYFTTTYFLVTTVISIILAAVAAWLGDR